jgi:hypothetical protein
VIVHPTVNFTVRHSRFSDPGCDQAGSKLLYKIKNGPATPGRAHALR